MFFPMPLHAPKNSKQPFPAILLEGNVILSLGKDHSNSSQEVPFSDGNCKGLAFNVDAAVA